MQIFLGAVVFLKGYDSVRSRFHSSISVYGKTNEIIRCNREKGKKIITPSEVNPKETHE
jgi:hypothetical protein